MKESLLVAIQIDHTLVLEDKDSPPYSLHYNWRKKTLTYTHTHMQINHTLGCTYSNHVTSSKQADTLICHTTMCRISINFIHNPGHVTLWCLEVVPVANARAGLTQEHNWARVMDEKFYFSSSNYLGQNCRCKIFSSWKYGKMLCENDLVPSSYIHNETDWLCYILQWCVSPRSRGDTHYMVYHQSVELFFGLTYFN